MSIEIVSMERDAKIPAPDDMPITNGWLRPRLLGHRPIVFVNMQGEGQWEHIYRKRKKRNDFLENQEKIKAKKAYRLMELTRSTQKIILPYVFLDVFIVFNKT